jgi:PilZ domain
VSAAAAQAPVPGSARRFARYRASVPLELTILRSGVPEGVPGRMLDVGEGGLAAALAGEVRTTQTVGIEFKLPESGVPIRARAVVRHQAELQCGLEFVRMSPAQREMMVDWLRSGNAALSSAQDDPKTGAATAIEKKAAAKVSAARRGRRWLLLALAALCLASLVWWRWQQGWKELEQNIPSQVLNP